MTTEESTYTATFKAGTGFDAPWLVVRANDEAELETRLRVLENNTTFGTIGRLAKNFAGQYQLGNQLGATGVAAPVSAPVAAEPQYAGGSLAPAPAAAPAYQAPAAAPAAAPPGVPIILGQPAKLVDKGSWKAWADPRPQAATANATIKTDNPSHPGLADGSAKFWKFIR